MTKKAAIVIGVNKTGGLTPLRAAASCADEVAEWLEGEGYDVASVTDAKEPVTTARVSTAIDRFVTVPPRYHQLLVYFSGHGYWHARSDIWLFSEAPGKTHEGINLDGAIDLARYSGIPNVVFVSDACRSIPDARTGALMTGIDAFPNFSDIDDVSKIDVFKATSDAQQAYEGDIDGKPRSLLTHALLSAFEEPTSDMVRQVQENGTTITVVPNRCLETFLQDKVTTTLAGFNINLSQKIEANVPSSDDVYIARVKSPTPAAAPPLPRPPLPSIEGDVSTAVGSILSDGDIDHADDLTTLTFGERETSRELEFLLPVDAVDHFESQCGFSIRGIAVMSAHITKSHGAEHAEILAQGSDRRIDFEQRQPVRLDGDDGVVRIWDVDPGESVLLRFSDGRGAIVAALAGYIGHVVCGPDGVSNVSYVPSSNHSRWNAYAQKRSRVDRLRALVALATDHNAFTVGSGREATKLADEIRMEKALDPTLGLYAAHAYAQAGRAERVRDLAGYMRADLGAELFDVRVLSFRRFEIRNGVPLLPFCPLLTQTWSLLRPRGVDLPPVLLEAAAYLCNSLWTTFEPRGAEMLQSAMVEGELK